MPAPSTQPETEALLEKSVDAMLAQAGAAEAASEAPPANEAPASDAPPAPIVEGEILAPEELAPAPEDPVASALAAVAKDLDELRLETTTALPRPPSPDASAGSEDGAPPEGARAIASIDELDRALAEIAQEQIVETEADHASAAAEKVRAVLEQASGAEPECAVTPQAPEPGPSADAAPSPDHDTPQGEFAAPDAPEAPPPAPEAAAPPEAPAPSHPTAAKVAAASPAAVQAAPAPRATPKETQVVSTGTPDAAAGAKTGRFSLRETIVGLFAVVNEPFRDLSPGARDTLSLIAIITLFNAVCLWAFIFLR